MYWNRDMFNSNAIPSYPRYWDEFTTLNAKLTQKDTNGNIRTSAVAFGDFTNVVNAREIVASLLMQISNPITAYNAQGSLVSTLRSTSASSQPKLAFDYFAQSVDPTNTNYSWNRGMPDSRTAFLFGRLATYFGFASEISDIRSKNPNLNFDIAPLPQARTGGIKASYARMYGLSIVRSSSNINGTYQVLAALTSPTNLAYLSQQMYLPPVLISLISAGSSDPYMTIFNAAALIGKTWLDVDPGTSMVLFGDAVEAITSGQSSSFQAVENAGLRYDVLLRQATGQ
jgi:ABC-type glycerol-3-phosphate transport system substrate-binding protein